MATATTTAGGADSDSYGGFWIRVLAYSADLSIIMIGLVLLAVPLYFLGGAGIAVYSVLAAIAPFAYFVWFTASARQATFGKQLCGLRVEHVGSGQRISLLRSLGRELGKFVSATIFMIGYLMVGFTGRKQGLHDVLAATVVVREGPARILLALIVAFLSALIPIIAVLAFGAFFAGLMAVFMGGMADDVMKMKPVPQESQPIQQPKPSPAETKATVPAPVAVPVPVAAPAPATAPAPSAAAPLPAVEAKPAPVPAKAAAPAPAMAAKSEAAAPVAASAPPRPKAEEKIAMPAFGPGVEGPKFNDVMTAVLYRDAAAVEALLKLGKWVDKPDPSGLTPLMMAAQIGDAACAEALLKGGADPNLSGPRGVSAGSIAREKRDAAMVALLQTHGLR